MGRGDSSFLLFSLTKKLLSPMKMSDSSSSSSSLILMGAPSSTGEDVPSSGDVAFLVENGSTRSRKVVLYLLGIFVKNSPKYPFDGSLV